MKVLISLLCVSSVLLSLSLTIGSVSPENGDIKHSREFVLGEDNLELWKDKISGFASAPSPAAMETDSDEQYRATLVLAANRTERPDILRGFKPYKLGWDITNIHYWASVGFTGAAAFIIGAIWFVSFGVVLMIHYCCGLNINIKGQQSQLPQRICIVLLLVFTCVAAVGCVVLSVGQNEFHGEALGTLKYVVNQSEYTVEILRNVTQYLSLAKDINVAQVFLPSEIMGDIDKLNVELNSAADTLTEKTTENSIEIKKVFNLVRSALISVAAVMLIIALIGLVLSIFGYQHAIHIFIFSGWLLVAITFLLCGIFVILNNTISDTCMAMGEWVENPHAETALSNILPCVDQNTTNESLRQSKQTINGIVTVVNTFIYTYANAGPTTPGPYSYNQSGPLMPPLCYPFDSSLQDTQCSDRDVSIANASSVWRDYMCSVSEMGTCVTPGRVTPEIYSQLTAAVNESYALEHYTPPLLSFQDCNFVRETFRAITSRHCGPLAQRLKLVNAGLALVSVGLLLCLLLWIILFANRPQTEEVFVVPSKPANHNLTHIAIIQD